MEVAAEEVLNTLIVFCIVGAVTVAYRQNDTDDKARRVLTAWAALFVVVVGALPLWAYAGKAQRGELAMVGLVVAAICSVVWVVSEIVHPTPAAQRTTASQAQAPTVEERRERRARIYAHTVEVKE